MGAAAYCIHTRPKATGCLGKEGSEGALFRTLKKAEVKCMPKKFALLRGKMRERGITEPDMAAALDCSVICVSQRLRALRAWKLDEIWTVMRILHIPDEEMHRYFPLNGTED